MRYALAEINGRVVSVGDSGQDVPVVPPGLVLVDTNGEFPDPDSVRVVDGVVVPLPERPSRHHEFNHDAGAWEPDLPAAWRAVRAQRNDLLAATDWVRLRAEDRGEPVPQEWLDYRQALRDITEQADPLNITWPDPPT